MELSQKLLGMMFVTAVLTGLALGVLYDIFRISRVLCRQTCGLRLLEKLLLVVEDLVFGVACGIVLILLLYYTNDGKFRALAPLGMGCGFWVYYVTVGKLVMRVSEALATALHKLIAHILRLLSLPFRRLGKLFMRIVGNRIAQLVAKRRLSKAIRATEREAERLRTLAAQGFGLGSAANKKTNTQEK